jgi:hypothetical protein
MISTEYAAQVLAWTAVWAVGGLNVRQWLAGRRPDERQHQR